MGNLPNRISTIISLRFLILMINSRFEARKGNPHRIWTKTPRTDTGSKGPRDVAVCSSEDTSVWRKNLNGWCLWLFQCQNPNLQFHLSITWKTGRNRQNHLHHPRVRGHCKLGATIIYFWVHVLDTWSPLMGHLACSLSMLRHLINLLFIYTYTVYILTVIERIHICFRDNECERRAGVESTSKMTKGIWGCGRERGGGGAVLG